MYHLCIRLQINISVLFCSSSWHRLIPWVGGGGGGLLPYMGYIGMCRCEGHGFQAVYSSIGYKNQSVWV